MKISLAINFPLCYLDIFDYFSRHTTNFSTFSTYFSTRASRSSSCVEKYVENVSTTLGKVNCPAKIHYCMAI